MSEMARQLVDFLPFVFGVTNCSASRLNIQRIVEALVIAAFTAAGSAYMTVARVEERINYIQLSGKEVVALIRDEQVKRESADLRDRKSVV